jgi:hypothetical protein
MDKQQLAKAVELALAGDWTAAHELAQQDEDDPLACWIHAVLHKIEGDAGNARYWYRRADKSFESYADPKAELHAIATELL